MPFLPALKALEKQFMKAFLHSAVALYVLRVVSPACMLTGTLTKVLLAWLPSWQCRRRAKELLPTQVDICGGTARIGAGRCRVTGLSNVWAQRSALTQKREGFCAGQVGQNAHRHDQADDFFK